MIEYQLTDKEVRSVLMCLNDLHQHSLAEVTAKYNLLRPPSRFFPKPKDTYFVEGILRFLTQCKPDPLVRSEIYTFYEEPIPPTKYYSLTAAGIQFANARR